MTTLAQLHDCHSCNDERSIVQKKKIDCAGMSLCHGLQYKHNNNNNQAVLAQGAVTASSGRYCLYSHSPHVQIPEVAGRRNGHRSPSVFPRLADSSRKVQGL